MADEIPEGYKKVRKSLYPEAPGMPIEYELVPRTEGWNLEFGSPESLALWKKQKNDEINALIPKEYAKDPQDRFRPPDEYNPLSLDVLSTGEYGFASLIKKIAYPETSLQESFTGKLTQYDLAKEEWIKTGKDPFGLFTPRPYDEPGKEPLISREVSGRFIFSLLDPAMYTSAIRTGVNVMVNGRNVQLTDQGTRILRSMYKGVDPKLWPKVQWLFSNMLKTDPKLYSTSVAKTGLRIAWTNIEVIPRQYLPWTWVGPTAKKIVDVGRNSWDVVATALTRQFAPILAKIPKKVPLPPPPSFNQMRASNLLDLKYAKKAAEDRLQLLIDEAKKQTGNFYNPRVIMTEYAENPNIRDTFPELKPIYDKWEAIRIQMAAIEKAEGLLHAERFGYVRHYLTWVAKKKKGAKDTQPETGKALFDITRKVEGSISQINTQSLKKDGYKLFNDDFFFATLKRMQEHEQSLASVKLIKSAGQQYGKAAKEVAGNKNYVQSSFPQLNGVYLPKEIEQALIADKNVAQVAALMGMKTKYQTAKEVAILPFRKAYEFQAWTLHTWEKLQTRYFPAFYAVNFYGGKFMAWLGGSADLADDAAAIAKIRGRVAKDKVLVTDSITGKEYTKEMIDALADEYKLTRTNMLGVQSGKEESKGITGGIVKAGWMMEEELRLAMFINRLRKGDKPADAYAYVIKYQFDYTSEVKGMDKIIGDFIPFWTWQKNAIPFFAQMTFEAYGKMGIFGKLAASTWTSPEAEVTEPYIPDWARIRPNFYLGGDKNEMASINLPMAQWAESIRRLNGLSNATQVLGPVPQIANKWITGIDPYTGKNITSSDAVINTMLGRWMQTTKKAFNPDIPFWEKLTEIGTGTQIIQLNEQMAYSGILNRTGNRMVTNALHRLNGRYRGCGV